MRDAGLRFKGSDRHACFILSGEPFNLLIGEDSPAHDNPIASKKVQNRVLPNSELIREIFGRFALAVPTDDFGAALWTKAQTDPMSNWATDPS